ncbi:MAG TPA: lysophospholipid acyltransferase family protein [Actinomycetota bacterium]|nr:lysophospholipid acyltransferase family protein [Actinomycetota bacterium]
MGAWGDLRDVAKGWRWGRRTLVPRSASRHTPTRLRGQFPTAWARTPVAKAAREVLLSYGLRPLVRNETAPKVHGLENLEGLEGPVILVSNHTSHLDASLIMTSLPRKWREKTATGAAADYFFDTWWRSIFTALVYNAFPIDRTGRGHGATDASHMLHDGWSLIVFPEGTRSPDGWMQRFRTGAARLAVQHAVPVVPIAIRGAYAAMPKGRNWPRPGRLAISVRFGRPLHPGEDEDHRSLTRRMFQAVAELFDEDSTTWFESVRRAERGETPAPSGPEGPRWLRAWEASRSLPRRGRRPAWRR